MPRKLDLTFVIFLLLFCQLCNLHAQYPAEQLYFSHEIERLIAHDSIRPASASRQYSYIGDYHHSIYYSDNPVSWGVDSIEVGSFEIKPALETIIDIAKDQQIVIISESHSRPQHRIFSKNLIDSLSHFGFQTLYMEALGNFIDSSGVWKMTDAKLNERAYPLKSLITGTYTREPEMASLLRNAKQSGYELRAYESFGRKKGQERDRVQAENIIEQFQGEKTIIHCGWFHAIESNDLKRGKYSWLAKHLKDSLKIDPLTIYQDNFIEKIKYDEHPEYAQIDIDKPSVFIKNGSIPRLTEQVDIEVLHPRTTYKNSRPQWLYEDGKRIKYEHDFSTSELDFPIFMKAFIPGEEVDGVPVDIVEIKSKYDQKPLVLKPGNYILEITNKKQSDFSEIAIIRN